MEHIRQFDWCNHTNYSPYFIEEKDLDNCVTEQILRGKFVDPLFSSDSEDDTQEINWTDLIAKKRKLAQFASNNDSRYGERKLFIPGLKPVPQYPKLSALTSQQHNQILKVLTDKSLGSNAYSTSSSADKSAAEDLNEIYKQEQEEYIQWAKTMWATGHNIRALRPLPSIEIVYDSYFKVHLNALSSIPKEYEMVAQINLQSEGSEYEFVHKKDLLQVDFVQLPQIRCPNLNRMFTVYKHQPPLPTVCPKHPCRFVLPMEKTVSSLPLSEIQEELAHYAAENEGQYIVSEEAMQCLLQHNASWMLLVSVRRVQTKDGTTKNIFVINNDICTKKKPARLRTKYALKCMLEHALIPHEERQKYLKANIDTEVKVGSTKTQVERLEAMDLISDDEEENLIIDMEESLDNNEDNTDAINSQADSEEQVTHPKDTNKDSSTNNDTGIPIDEINVNGMLNCNCKGTIFEKPPKRSYKRWKLTNKTRNEDLNIIIHCEHRARGPHQELVVDATPEYQLELGGAARSVHAARALVLSLLLRRAATVYSVRLDPSNGHVVHYDYMSIDDLQGEPGLDLVGETANMLHTTLSQLQGLLPGDYLLQHEVRHGANALLYVARSQTGAGHGLVLDMNNVELSDDQERASLVAPVSLELVVLPYHRHRRILPLAFSPHPNQIAKQTKPPPEKKPAFVAKKKPKKRKKKTKSSKSNNLF